MCCRTPSCSSASIRRSITTGCEELSDAPYCIRCKHEYVYDYVTYGHLGGYRCPNCGYRRPQPQVHVTKVLRTDDEHSEVDFRRKTESGSAKHPPARRLQYL